MIRLVIVCIALLAASASASMAQARPMRIVTLAPSMTEAVFAMGAGDRVVGVTDFCDWPEEARTRPRIGGMSNPSIEAVIGLAPDLVVMTMDGNPREFEARLREFGIKTFVSSAKRIADLPDAYRAIGREIGAPEGAEALARELEAALSAEAPMADGPRALFVVWPEPLMAAGPGTAIHDVMTLIGLRNIAADSPIPYPKFSLEEALMRMPEVIFLGSGSGMENMGKIAENLLSRLASTPAVRNGRVYYLSDSLYRLGPRIVPGMREMRRAVEAGR